MILEATPIIGKVRGLCRNPYPNHPRGCPNWNKRDNCPPRSPLIGDIIDLRRSVVFAINRFDFAGHVLKMKDRHPNWSQRQLANCLYWQGTARKQLRGIVKAYMDETKPWLLGHPPHHVLYCPEATGVDVTATLAAVGVHLEWPPVTVTYQVALIGHPHDPPAYTAGAGHAGG